MVEHLTRAAAIAAAALVAIRTWWQNRPPSEPDAWTEPGWDTWRPRGHEDAP